MLIDLKPHRALVCGASKGIGLAIAQAFAESGAEVVLLARSAEPLQRLLKELPGTGHQFIALDLKDHNQLRLALKEEIEARGPLSIVVNNAGGPKSGPLIEAESAEFVDGLNYHLLAAHQIVQLCVAGMKAQGFGRVLNVISTSVKVPIANLGVSNTVRGAMASWAKTLANELGPFGITVNNLLPGYTQTERLNELKRAAATKLDKSEAEIEALWLKQVPAQRFGEPQELAALATFLASPKASYINGVSIQVDGGRTGAL